MTARLLLVLSVLLLSTGWTIRDLSTVPGCGGSFATAINNSGMIVGAVTNCGGSVQRAAVFEPGPITVISPTTSVANDVNESGFVVGQAGSSAFTYQFGFTPTLFASAGMYAVDEWQNAAGFRWTSISSSAGDVWVGGTTPYYLGHLGSGESSSAYDIEETVPVVVGWSDYDQANPGLYHAFLWDNDVMFDLGTLGGGRSKADGVAVIDWPDPSYSTTYVVGDSETATGDFHAFLWNAGTMYDLGVLPGHIDSRALAVNRAGVAVGVSSNGLVEQRAVMWVGGSIVDLNTLIDKKSGWFLQSASDINEYGYIVGSGLFWGQPRAFVMKP